MSRKHPELFIFQSELRAIALEASKYINLETGGDLYGCWTHGDRPIIFIATGPGPSASRTSSEFQQDHKYIMECEKKLYRKYGIQYLGDWHSHHKLNLPHPSGGDIARIRRYAEKTGRDRLVEIIVTHTVGNQPFWGQQQLEQINTYLYTNVNAYHGEPIAASLSELEEEESPIRKGLTFQNAQILNCLWDWRSFPKDKIIFSPNAKQPNVEISKNINQDLESKLNERLGKYFSYKENNAIINPQTMVLCIPVNIQHQQDQNIYLFLETPSLQITDVQVLLGDNQISIKEKLELEILNQKPNSIEATIEQIISQKLIETL